VRALQNVQVTDYDNDSVDVYAYPNFTYQYSYRTFHGPPLRRIFPVFTTSNAVFGTFLS
jgi:hypothetical protein